MVVEVISWEFSLPGCTSLKEKRSVLRSVKDRLRSRFNVSVSETAFHDVHSRGEISAAWVTTDQRQSDAVASSLDDFVASHARAVLVGTRRERL
ncbi:MAG: DUF503 domain-containing protein [Gemmatimonadota bacterium]